MHKEICTDYNE
jgi:SpoVK/Ycf46/Vps4 family AAA+-type ATPase